MLSYYMELKLARVHQEELIKEAKQERQLRQAYKNRGRSSRLRNLLDKITHQT